MRKVVKIDGNEGHNSLMARKKPKLSYNEKQDYTQWKAEIKEKTAELLKRRNEKQPLNYPSAGSTFKRKPPYITAKLIDEAGLKGLSVGGASVSEKHAGFIVNNGGASAADVICLIDTVKARLDIYHAETEPLKDYYGKQGKLVIVEGQEKVDDTTALTLKALEA